MARSKYIYVVQDYLDVVQAAFTVKHEMQTWCRNRDKDLTYAGCNYSVLRMRDGEHGPKPVCEFLTYEEIFGRE